MRVHTLIVVPVHLDVLAAVLRPLRAPFYKHKRSCAYIFNNYSDAYLDACCIYLAESRIA